MATFSQLKEVKSFKEKWYFIDVCVVLLKCSHYEHLPYSLTARFGKCHSRWLDKFSDTENGEKILLKKEFG